MSWTQGVVEVPMTLLLYVIKLVKDSVYGACMTLIHQVFEYLKSPAIKHISQYIPNLVLHSQT